MSCAFLEADTLRCAGRRPRASNWDAGARRRDQRDVMPVRAGDREAGRCPARVGTHAAPRPQLPAFRGVPPHELSADRRLRHGAVRRRPAPVDPPERGVLREPAPPLRVKVARGPRLRDAAVGRGGRAEPRGRERVLLAPGQQRGRAARALPESVTPTTRISRPNPLQEAISRRVHRDIAVLLALAVRGDHRPTGCHASAGRLLVDAA